MEYLLGILGIIVSIGTFLVGYRQTVGARKERVRSANDEIEKIMVRRIVLEDLVPSTDTISRLMEAKSRDFKVKVSDLYSEAQILNTIYARIMETDLIAKDQRERIVTNLEPVLQQSEKEPFTEQQALEIASRPKGKSGAENIPVAMLGAAASIIGAMVAMAPEILEKGFVIGEFEQLFFPVLLVSIAAVYASSVIVRFKDKQEDTSRESTIRVMDQYFQLESEVLKNLKKINGLNISGAGSDSGYDFNVSNGDKKYIIEVKGWKRRPPPTLLRRTVERVLDASQRESADEAFIVTKEKLSIPPSISETDKVKIITLSELKSRLAT